MHRSAFMGLGAYCFVLAGSSLWPSPVKAAAVETVLHDFTGGTDGATPWGRLALDELGSLYGVNSEGGQICSGDTTYGCGVIYKVDSTGALTPLHEFSGGNEGNSAETGLTVFNGQILGAANGGSSGNGVTYSMDIDGGNYAVSHQFSGADGSDPAGLLLPAEGGGVYGVTVNGGTGYTAPGSGGGVLFFEARNGPLEVRHYFHGGPDGKNPNGIVVDSSGDLFGSTFVGGGACASKAGCGTIFEYNARLGTYTTIYAFQDGTDGRNPMLGGVDSKGNLYGAASGGTYNHGTLFSLSQHNGAYSFLLLATLKSLTEGDQPVNPPALTPAGALVGATATYMYGYQSGSVEILATFGTAIPITNPLGQFLVGRHSIIYGTSNGGGIAPCLFSNGQKDPSGCGSIFSIEAH